MTTYINPAWKEEQRKLFLNFKQEGIHFKLVLSHALLINWVITELISLDIKYKVINNGGSVKTITSNTEVCPTCGR